MPNESDKQRESTAWPRTLGAALGLGILLVVALLYVPQWILVELRLGDRSVLVWLATGWVAAVFVGLSYGAWRATDPRREQR